MKKLFFKIFIYSILILLALEVYIRVFHLTKDYPVRYVDEFGVEKWLPNQDGFSVTGNRRQNFSEYHINNFGYNSYREYNPSKDKIEIALVGDSFIEGFHQNYYNSLGKKIEDRLEGKEVYEFGYAGYDLADQLHLISQYKEQFALIDYVILGIKFENDLTRGEYNIVQKRMVLESPLYKAIRQIKLFVYLNNIGVLDAPKGLVSKLFSNEKKETPKLTKLEEDKRRKESETKYLDNFKSLINTYGFDKTRFVFLLDSEETPEIFLNHLNENNYKYIDFSEAFKKSKKPPILIYDMHWNNNGRSIIAELIANYIKEMKSI
ncbi:hypothetical protein [Confluentibacter flavum]|uniref:SGNH/GDSL hydrolase family protein n=1 Tax=Confluentibacter flavum TaxID=1909700 RepID=A0A2N3HGI3_9FLAO|nr:hypothetical protein [Confluentibacter flavum]PKQ44077.1 hypothetical protein CSW08_14850 [Confluentibacter flavum]